MREFEDYLACGRLENGFLSERCQSCSHEHLVAFSCKRRGFCTSCGARRMVETAALLVDHVLPISWSTVTGRAGRPRLPSNSRYRESVTPLSARQVKPATADVEADGPDEPDLRAGRRKGLCCTEGRPAKRLKRVFSRAA